MNIAEQLQSSQLFKGISQADLEGLASAMQTASFPVGYVLIKKDDPGDTMYLVLAGKLRIFTYDAEGNELVLTYYGPGRILGDFSLIDHRPRSASAVAEEPLDVAFLQRDTFMEVLPKYPAIGLALIRNLADRVRHVTIYLNKVTGFAQRLAAGEYEQAITEIAVSSDDDEIQGLFKAYLDMVRKIQERENILKQAST